MKRGRLSEAIIITTVLGLAHAVPLAVALSQDKGVGVQVSKLPEAGKRWAVVIGIDEYQGQLSGLAGAQRDAKALAEALVNYAGFPADQVILLADNEPPGRLPTRANILKYLSNLRGTAPKDGLLLVAFSGHGIERGGKSFLLPTDCQATEDISLLEDTAINVDRVREQIQRTGVKQVMLILDACRNDPAPGRSEADNKMTEGFSRNFDFTKANESIEAFVTLYATSVGDRAYEYQEKQQGYFTYVLVEGLKGAAANPNGQVTLGSLKRYIEQTVPKLVRRDLGAERRQRPRAIVEGYQAEDLVLAMPPHANLLKPKIPLPRGIDPTRLAVHDFTTATVDANGKVTRFAGVPTQQYIEDLGNGVRLEMVAVKGGTFTMGSEKGSSAFMPAHQVTLGDFWIGKFEVTQAQWSVVMGNNPSYHLGDNLPVDNVEWVEARDFCQRLNGKLGLSAAEGYRLPSEAEWEYATRAGGKTELALGEIITTERVNHDQIKTVPVGSLGIANAWGIFDLHGNVYEWCEDDWRDSYDGAPTDGRAWVGMYRDPRNSHRVMRSCNYRSGPISCVSANRNGSIAASSSIFSGFRLVRSDRPVVEGQIHENVITVDASRPWTDTGIDVQPGMSFEISAEGEIEIDSGRGCNPDGVPRDPNVTGNLIGNEIYPIKDEDHGALILKIRYRNGQDSNLIRIGVKGHAIVEQGEYGRLFLGINDHNFQDNRGVFTVKIRWL